MTEDIIRRIAGLLANAESLAEMGNEEAADAYVQKAHQLQQKYSIDQAMLAAREGKPAAVVIQRKVPMPGVHGRRRIHLAHYVAEATDCTGYFSSNNWSTKKVTASDGTVSEVTDWNSPKFYAYTVFGFTQDVEWVEALCTSLNHQLDEALAVAMKDKPSWENGRSYAVAFVEGFATRIHERLLEAKREARKEAEQAEQKARAEAYAHDGEAAFVTGTPTTTAIVLANKKQRVEEEFKAKVGTTRKSSTSHVGGSGYGAGKAAGGRANLARGSVGGGKGKGQLGR